MIKDSGERTEFTTGAVRDMHEGKGRFDLLPWNAIWDVAKHCEEGAKKYGERNVDKGIPQHSLIDSAIRHIFKYIENWNDEDHLRAAAWNILWALEQRTTHPELDDLPFRDISDESISRVQRKSIIFEFKGKNALERAIKLADYIESLMKVHVDGTIQSQWIFDYAVHKLGGRITGYDPLDAPFTGQTIERILEITSNKFTGNQYSEFERVKIEYEVKE